MVLAALETMNDFTTETLRHGETLNDSHVITGGRHVSYEEITDYETPEHLIYDVSPYLRGSILSELSGSTVRIKDEAFVDNCKRYDVFTAGAAAMFGDVERAAHFRFIPNLSHEDDRIGVRQDVATFDRAA